MTRLLLFSIFFSNIINFGYECYAQEKGSLDLLNNAKQYDGEPIVYKGEIIGDIMVRGDHAWLHVNDGTIAIGVWIPKNLIGNISFAGDYQKRGDILEVSGIFHRSCLEHGGDLDIHASEIKKAASGNWTVQPISRIKVFIGILSLIFVLVFWASKKFLLSK